MKLSARNCFPGTVAGIKRGAINSEVELALPGEKRIVAVITNESVENLGLTSGREAYAIIKAPLVIIAKGAQDLKFSTRNVLTGTVKGIRHGQVNAEISLDISGGLAVSSIITEESVKSMELKEGDEVSALFKASNVILAVKA